jgi:hypothetical protein
MSIARHLEDIERFLQVMEDYLAEQAQAATGQEQTELEKAFPNLLRSSVFVTIYSAIEAELTRLCRRQQQSRSLKLNLDELRGNGIVRAHNYLSRVCEIKVPKGKYWRELLDYNALRNVIVHPDGEENHRTLLGLIRENPYLEKDSLDIYLAAPFCREVIASARDFFAQLEEAIKE